MYSPSRSPLPPPSPPDPSGSSQCTSPEHLSHASNLGWWSVSPLIVYLFQCCSLRTSHPRLLPQSPKVCSVHFFFKSTVIATDEVSPSRLPSFTTFTRNQSVGASSRPSCLSVFLWSADRFGQVSSSSWLSRFRWDPQFYLAVEQVACPFPFERYCGGPAEIYQGMPTHSVSLAQLRNTKFAQVWETELSVLSS